MVTPPPHFSVNMKHATGAMAAMTAPMTATPKSGAGVGVRPPGSPTTMAPQVMAPAAPQIMPPKTGEEATMSMLDQMRAKVAASWKEKVQGEAAKKGLQGAGKAEKADVMRAAMESADKKHTSKEEAKKASWIDAIAEKIAKQLPPEFKKNIATKEKVEEVKKKASALDRPTRLLDEIRGRA